MDSTSEDGEEQAQGLIAIVKDKALVPFRAAASPTARRAYISTFLFISTAVFLLFLAVVAYILFYFAYVPARGLSRPIHLQFSPSDEHFPYGTATFDGQLASAQRYDVNIILHMPRTPRNREAGNFMLDLKFLSPEKTHNGVAAQVLGPQHVVLAHEARPATLTYQSDVLEGVWKVLQLPLFALGWRQESEMLEVPMMEGVEFVRGWRNVPSQARLELQSTERLQVYGVKMVVRARFMGLRYVLYNHRIFSFIFFTSSFWSVEMGFATAAWVVLSFFVFPGEKPTTEKSEPEDDAQAIKDESEEEDSEGLSDTSRTFPTFSRQPPLRYSLPRVKKEESEKPTASQAVPPALEADDEDEDADFLLEDPGTIAAGRDDSGLGTSLESNVERRESVRRRPSRLPRASSADKS